MLLASYPSLSFFPLTSIIRAVSHELNVATVGHILLIQTVRHHLTFVTGQLRG